MFNNSTVKAGSMDSSYIAIVVCDLLVNLVSQIHITPIAPIWNNCLFSVKIWVDLGGFCDASNISEFMCYYVTKDPN